MTNQQHPIIPSPELVQQWRDSPEYTDGKRKLVMVTLSTGKLQDIATKASQWGADQELDACCEWFVRDWTDIETADKLRAARRPKPPNKKQRGLTALKATNLAEDDPLLYQEILNAIESLPS